MPRHATAASVDRALTTVRNVIDNAQIFNIQYTRWDEATIFRTIELMTMYISAYEAFEDDFDSECARTELDSPDCPLDALEDALEDALKVEEPHNGPDDNDASIKQKRGAGQESVAVSGADAKLKVSVSGELDDVEAGSSKKRKRETAASSSEGSPSKSSAASP